MTIEYEDYWLQNNHINTFTIYTTITILVIYSILYFIVDDN